MFSIDHDTVKSDTHISDELLFESRRTPQLHNKYNVMWLNLSQHLISLNAKMKKLMKVKWEYYTGKASPEVYRDKPFSVRVLKTDLHLYLDQDDEIVELQTQIDQVKNELKFVEETLKQINQRTFHIKNSIDYLKFINGVS